MHGAVPRTDEDVLGPARTVNEVPGAQTPLLAFDQEQALARENEEVLLGLLAVVQRIGFTGAEDPDPEAQLREARVRPLERRVAAAELVAVEPLGIASVHDEPSVTRGNEPAVLRLERGLGHHRL
jgi:hypothetical protein